MSKAELKERLSQELGIPKKYINILSESPEDYSIDSEWKELQDKEMDKKIDKLEKNTVYHLGTGEAYKEGDSFHELSVKKTGGQIKKKRKRSKKKPRGWGKARYGK